MRAGDISPALLFEGYYSRIYLQLTDAKTRAPGIRDLLTNCYWGWDTAETRDKDSLKSAQQASTCEELVPKWEFLSTLVEDGQNGQAQDSGARPSTLSSGLRVRA